ncbi:MAG: 7-cyano-7-deazaguanine synthase [Pseudomonadales bacterium]|nr:7-cyano-7-deazaguanine synthase [Pseudomonadales bacterium]
MSVVTLLSGGMDSCLMSVLAMEAGVEQKPVFINYGQINIDKEVLAVRNHIRKFGLPECTEIDISGFGSVITSGLTDKTKHIVDEAFLPGRNLLFLLIASSFAVQNDCRSVSIGLLREDTAIFPDQTDDFLISAEHTISKAMGQTIEIVAPLRDFYKKDVIDMANEKGISSYSCHVGGDEPCGVCISCKEFEIKGG